MNHNPLIDQLNHKKNLSPEDWEALIASYTEADASYAAALARDISQKHFGNAIYFRGIIEFSNICKNNCLYCGIRRENGNLTRYRLTEDDDPGVLRRGIHPGLPHLCAAKRRGRIFHR